ncbi:hypothetical protein [Micrococcus luteus]|uniref:hypothetical protein n=1 Tax=Micrococcus luteus TaxID=1270 RepID=UPI00146F4504|nr:hypothetical protein [Micrococcus luteus]MBY0170536.1 hypothetical protein [Micrococcus luteus]
MTDGLTERNRDSEELVRVSFLITKGDRARLKVAAAKRGVTMSEVLRAAVEKFCDEAA